MDENVIKRTPPHSVEAERSVIGSMILNKDAIVIAVEKLIPEDFYRYIPIRYLYSDRVPASSL